MKTKELNNVKFFETFKLFDSSKRLKKAMQSSIKTNEKFTRTNNLTQRIEQITFTIGKPFLNNLL